MSFKKLSKLVFCNFFYHAAEKGSTVPLAVDKKFQIYYKNQIVFFSSLRRLYQNEKMILFLDRYLPNKYLAKLSELNVELIIVPKQEIKYVTNEIIPPWFPGCLFLLDVFSYLEKTNIDASPFVFLDSDCIVLERFDKIIRKVKENNLIATMKISEDNNFDLKNIIYYLSVLSYLHDKSTIGHTSHYGGGCYIFNKSILKLINNEASKVWQTIEKSFIKEYSNIITEEYLLSVVFKQLENKIITVNSIMKYAENSYKKKDDQHCIYSVNRGIKKLKIVHLVRDKKYGLMWLYRYLQFFETPKKNKNFKNLLAIFINFFSFIRKIKKLFYLFVLFIVIFLIFFYK